MSRAQAIGCVLLIMEEMNRVHVNICNMEFALVTTETDDYVQNLAQTLDGQIRDIMKASPAASVTSAAILVAMDLSDKLSKKGSGEENLRGQIRDYANEANRAVLELSEIKRENQRLKQEMENLKNQNK